jgi:hypothetical protein
MWRREIGIHVVDVDMRVSWPRVERSRGETFVEDPSEVVFSVDGSVVGAAPQLHRSLWRIE